MSEIKIVLYEPSSRTLSNGGLELLEKWKSQAGTWVWVNISGEVDGTETSLLSERFAVSQLAIQDACRDRHSPT